MCAFIVKILATTLVETKRRIKLTMNALDGVEQGIAAAQQKEKAFFQLAECLRAATDPQQVTQLGNELGRFVFCE